MSESIDFSKLSINQLEETEHIESVSYTHLTLPTIA